MPYLPFVKYLLKIKVQVVFIDYLPVSQKAYRRDDEELNLGNRRDISEQIS
jgi:hypothetical protein